MLPGILCVVVGLNLSSVAQAQRLVWLGSMGTPYAEARGVSHDGSAVAGWVGVASPHKAFRWTEGSGMEDLGSFSKRDAEAWGISGDGGTVVGYSFVGTSGSVYHAAVWRTNQMLDLGTLGGATSWARGANLDGTVIVGAAQLLDGFNRAFRWTQTGGMENLGVLPGAIRSVAWAVTPDGETVVGWSGYQNLIHHAFRWTRQTGMVDLHDGSRYNWSEADGVSADGTTVVGAAETISGQQHAFRWTAQTGMQDLGVLAGSGTWSEAWAVSADGRIVVGWSEVASG
jgi:probable HAF family extracellular repeat protein